MSKTIHETIEQLHGALKDYIEATYHIGSPALIAQRRKLLETPGVIHQVPYIESTPRYQSGEKFADIAGLPKGALSAYQLLSKASSGIPSVLYDPPYLHQSDAVRATLVEGRNLVIMTGTGSGKTESFLLPILGKFAREASENPKVFSGQPAMRALVLYPMNALVNDQLGRMRTLFGDARLVQMFKDWSGRPIRFARYTSRTPYAGVRTPKKDPRKLKSFEDFYVDIERFADDSESEQHDEAKSLRHELRSRGKWPAKPSLSSWFGARNSRWADAKKNPLRAVVQPDDSELVTRHEVQTAPPDLLVTNYSMLEYMLMRPIERSIFDRTSEWLRTNPKEKFLVVLDEAHLYRGAPGAEVGLLLRRLRARMNIGIERFQVICATASFSDPHYAPEFGAQLSGADPQSFAVVTGQHKLESTAADGREVDASLLASVDLQSFYADEAQRRKSVQPLLLQFGVSPTANVDQDLYQALKAFPPLGKLVNVTMKEATPLASLGEEIFPGVEPSLADSAVTTLLALGSVARPDVGAAGLLPCRVHNFFRGLPGLWICMDPDCKEVHDDVRSTIGGRLYSQPRERCDCGGQVLEFFTCRNCGTAYGRAYSDDVERPSALWSTAGRKLRMPDEEVLPLLPVDLLLEAPKRLDVVEPMSYDIETGRLNPNNEGPRMREVHLRKNRFAAATGDDGEIDTRAEARGQFVPCGVCGTSAPFARTSVQDHQTKGDQPFQTLVTRQLQVQPPSAAPETAFAPLRGRKVLVFSDSRQVAARLAPNLQMYSTRDSLRPMLVWGFSRLQANPSIRAKLCLDDAYLAVLLAAKKLKVRLRPETAPGETLQAIDTVNEAVDGGSALTDDASLLSLWFDMKGEVPPVALLDDIYKTVMDRHLGLEALALASIAEKDEKRKKLEALPSIPGVAETTEQKLAVVRSWLRCWRRSGIWMNGMPSAWWQRSSSGGTSVKGHKGKFEAMARVLSAKDALGVFTAKWLPTLMEELTVDAGGGVRRLEGKHLTLKLDGAWVRCGTCKSVHRPVPTLHHCLDCGSSEVNELTPETDDVFVARKGYYRKTVVDAFADPPVPPVSLIAAEHTAQLNAASSDDAFSKAEENELLFQDVELAWGQAMKHATAIDVLSSTTTMEVGIDIGALSGVALRNMPPGRANYQQRAGRAGRRGNAVATVVAFGSADSHDEHYFSNPQGMVRGPVVDPSLALDNPEIAKRHVRAFLLQTYHQERILDVDPEQAQDLFSVLGTVEGFRSKTGKLNRDDFAAWLSEHVERNRTLVAGWLPSQLSDLAARQLLDEMSNDCLTAVDNALVLDAEDAPPKESTDGESDAADEQDEVQTEEGEERPTRKGTPTKLLDRLLYCGVLPRYAFPTDVATFTVFDKSKSNGFRPVVRFSPSQSLPIALSQYAPGKEVWIANKCYTSGAIYSPMKSERNQAFKNRLSYRECRVCGFAHTRPVEEVKVGSIADCIACGGNATFGPARYWMRPPGFAHPIDVQEATSPDDTPETAYATRAKLTMPTPADDAAWNHVNDRIRVITSRQHLLVSNTGPEKEGYTYCMRCGRIESSVDPTPQLFSPHSKPYPDDDSACDGTHAFRHMVLGTDFITDIALFSFRLREPLGLRPGAHPTSIALRTISEALAKAACQILEVEPGEVLAEFRPALTTDPAGREGLEAEVFLYDTLPGGAGFSALAAASSDALFAEAMRIMKTCPENCDGSCYRCLRSFKNKIEHGLLDRHVGVELLEHLLSGELPEFNEARMAAATNLLLKGLQRQAEEGETFETGVPVSLSDGTTGRIPILVKHAADKRLAVLLAAPLANNTPDDVSLAQSLADVHQTEFVVVNELLVRCHLPAAVMLVQDAMKR